jgi:glycogen(starch) synthase
LFEAFSRIAADFPDLALVIAGMDGPEREALHDDAARLGLGGRLVCFVDLPRDSVARLLSRADACVQPSHAEPFGLAVIEAGACGVPLVASAVGGHVEILRHGETGLLFRAGDVDACAQALREVLADPVSGRARAERFLAEVRRDYTWQACAGRYLALATPAR